MTSPAKKRAYVALGSNLGERAKHLQEAVERLRHTEGITVLAVSQFLENPAVGGAPDSPPFINAVVEVETELGPRQLLDRLLEIERELGRIRSRKWDPRTIDLDLLLYEDQVLHEPGLTLPHPLMQQRRFVLQPLAQIAPKVRHPVLHKTIAELLASIRD